MTRIESVTEKLKTTLLSKVKGFKIVRKLMTLLFQENLERNNGLKKKCNFVRNIE